MALKVIPASGAGAGVTGSLWAARISGNTLGTTALVNSGTLSLNAGTNITLSQSATNKITILGPTNIVSAAIVAGNTSGTTASVSSGTLVLAGGNNITLSQVANAITISAFTQTVQTQNQIAAVIGGNTSGTTASVSSGTLNLFGGNNITLSQNAQSITISAGTIATLSASQLGFDAAPVGATLGNSTNWVYPWYVPAYLSATQARMGVSVSMSTNAASSFGGTLTMMLGLYTLNGVSLSLSTSGGTTYNFVDQSGGSTESLSGIRWFSLPMNVGLMTPGNYWLVMNSASVATGTGAAASIGISNIVRNAAAYGGSWLGATGGTNSQWNLGQGQWSAASAALPDSIRLTAIRQTNSRDNVLPWTWFGNTTA
jgi:hypothetical protein